MKAFGKSDIRKMTVVLAAFVALLTAYVLTLPAITVTQDAARPEAGFYIDGQQNTADAADAAGGSMAVGAASSISASVDVNSPTLGIPVPNTSRSDVPDTTSSSSNTNASTLDTPDTPAYPAQDLRQTADLGDGLTLEVRVEAAEGVLPEGTALRLDAIPDPATIDLMKAEAADRADMPADATGVIATDISLTAPDGSAVEPRGKVVVSLTCPVIEPGTQAAIAHVKYAEHPEDPDGPDGRDRADIVELRDLDGRDTVERSVEQHTIYFEATDFSPYGIVYLPPADGEPAVDVTPTPAPDAPAAMPAQSFTADVEAADGSAVTVTVEADEGAFPEGVTMSITPVEEAAVIDAAKAEAADKTPMDDDKAMRALAFDITFADADGNAVEPARPVRVSMATQAIADRDQLAVVHVDDDRSAEVVPADAVAADQGSVAFDAASFSVYALVYTVDFEYSVNGKMYQFSLPGGGFVSFTDLVELLGIIGDTNSGENGDENGSVITENSEENAANEAIEEDGINSDTNTTLTLGDVEVSEATRKFVADVTSVEFSSPELVDVSKVENETTVGQIKESRGLECENSAELTEEQIAEINAQTVKAGDWALISVQPFVSEETLTVTMKDGEVFSIHVTDAQIKKTVIDARGDTWEITVTYNDEAEIPEDAELRVREILPEDEEYEEYYQRSLEKVGVVAVPDTTEDEQASEVNDEDTAAETTSEENSVSTYAHIFDIQIWDDDHEIQPAADVSVSIKLLDAPEEDTDLRVVHFSKDGLEEMELTGDGEETGEQAEGVELCFVTNEFSVYSIVTGPQELRRVGRN